MLPDYAAKCCDDDKRLNNYTEDKPLPQLTSYFISNKRIIQLIEYYGSP